MTEVVCGGAPGVDTIGASIAATYKIPVTMMIAAWDLYGNAAGPIRNRRMAEYAEGLILIWDGKSAGSRNMLAEAKARGLAICAFVVDGSTWTYEYIPGVKTPSSPQP